MQNSPDQRFRGYNAHSENNWLQTKIQEKFAAQHGKNLDERKCLARSSKYLDARFRIYCEHPGGNCVVHDGIRKWQTCFLGLYRLQPELVSHVSLFNSLPCGSRSPCTRESSGSGPGNNLHFDRGNRNAIRMQRAERMDASQLLVSGLAGSGRWFLFQSVCEASNQQHDRSLVRIDGMDPFDGFSRICPYCMLCHDGVGGSTLYCRNTFPPKRSSILVLSCHLACPGDRCQRMSLLGNRSICVVV